LERLFLRGVLSAVDDSSVAKRPQEDIGSLDRHARCTTDALELGDLDYLLLEIDPLVHLDSEVVEGVEPSRQALSLNRSALPTNARALKTPSTRL
jgi:hypothetical protein